jgi:hypothetical protein
MSAYQVLVKHLFYWNFVEQTLVLSHLLPGKQKLICTKWEPLLSRKLQNFYNLLFLEEMTNNVKSKDMKLRICKASGGAWILTVDLYRNITLSEAFRQRRGNGQIVAKRCWNIILSLSFIGTNEEKYSQRHQHPQYKLRETYRHGIVQTTHQS